MAVPTRLLGRTLLWATLGLVLIWTLFPFVWAALYSIKPDRLEFTTVWIPFRQFTPTLAHWRWEWRNRWDVDGLGTAWVYGGAVALATATASAAIGLLAAVGLLRMRRRRLPVAPLLALFVLPRVIPPVSLLPPYALLLQVTRLGDTIPALVAAHTALALPLTVLLLDSAVRELPPELLEAAQLDGAGWGRLLWQVVVPLTTPMLLAAAVLAFALSWNELLFALIDHGQRVTTAPVAVALMEDKDGIQFGHVGSHIVLIVLPPMLLALAAQRYLARGLTMGAIHG